MLRSQSAIGTARPRLALLVAVLVLLGSAAARGEPAPTASEARKEVASEAAESAAQRAEQEQRERTAHTAQLQPSPLRAALERGLGHARVQASESALFAALQRIPLPWRERLSPLGEWALRPGAAQAAGALAALLLVAWLLLRLWHERPGDLVVAIEYPSELRGTFSVQLSRREPRVQASLRARRAARERASSATRHYMVSRETQFRRLRPRAYWVSLHGTLQDPRSGAQLTEHSERRRVELARGRTARAEFDLRPRGCPLEVRVLWDQAPVPSAAVAARGAPGTIRYARQGVARLELPPGRHRVVIASADRVAEVSVELAGFQTQPLAVELADAEQLLFRGCPPAAERYLQGDWEGAARALERDGQAEVAERVRAAGRGAPAARPAAAPAAPAAAPAAPAAAPAPALALSSPAPAPAAEPAAAAPAPASASSGAPTRVRAPHAATAPLAVEFDDAPAPRSSAARPRPAAAPAPGGSAPRPAHPPAPTTAPAPAAAANPGASGAALWSIPSAATPPATPPELEAGDPFLAGPDAGSRYDILEQIGRGGMGVVFKARDRRLGRLVALKQLAENLREHPTALELFGREARAAAALNHPNIVTLFDAGEEDGRFFLTMEFLEGSPLQRILKREGAIAPSRAARVGVQVATGLAYAHAQGIVHRDIKTANLFWTRDRAIKIMDFGLAKTMQEVRRATTVLGGTPYYMAPEQQTAGAPVDPRTDLYSLGVTLFELITGTLPFPSGDPAQHHRSTPAPDPRELQPGLPDELAALVLELLAKAPELRPASAEEVRSRLAALQ